MVTYSNWVSICFETARRKGFEASFEDNASVISVAAEVWNDRKQQLASASKSTAKSIADDEIHVQ